MQIFEKNASPTTKVKLTLKWSGPSRRGNFYVNMSPDDSLRSVRVKSQPSQQQCDNSVELEHLSQLIFDERVSGTLDTLPARIKVDERNFFGLIEWSAVRNSASSLLSKHAAAAGWRHRALSYVEQKESNRCPRIVAQSKETLMPHLISV